MNELVTKIANILYEKKAQNIVALNVKELTVITDAMLIATGRSGANEPRGDYVPKPHTRDEHHEPTRGADNHNRAEVGLFDDQPCVDSD